MKQSAPEHIPFLDYLRGLAILAVFLFHSVSPDPTAGHLELPWHGWFRDFNAPVSFLIVLPATLGWIGVSIFFVVSGFCIHLSHEKSRDKDFGIFFIRRFFRIYPPYLTALLIFAFLFPWSRLNLSTALLHTHSQLFYSLVSLGAHLTLFHNFSRDVAWSINGSFWSIAVEVQLYVIYPLLLVLVKRTGWITTLWITGIIEVGMRSFSAFSNIDVAWIVLNPLFFWFSWSIGAALADAYLKKQPLPFTGVPLFLFPVLTVIFYFIKPLSLFCFTTAALSTVYVMSHWMRNPEKAPLATGPSGFIVNHLRFVGLVSYSLYLIHEPMLGLLGHSLNAFFPTFPYLGVYALCLVAWFIIVGVAYLFYRFIELPSIALGKRVIELRRKRIATTPLVATEP
jgi:peptidoglycan/LPS O-acetylase OafA/YrhL